MDVTGMERGAVVGELDAALLETVEAIGRKRWTLTLDGDWEDGWIASATGRYIGSGYIEVTTRGLGWGADRGGLPTPAAALHALTAQLLEQGR